MPRRAALTLPELVLTLVGAAVLTTLVFPGIRKMREAAARVDDADNLRQIVLAFHQHAKVEKGRLKHSGEPFYRILPYLDHGTYYADVQASRRANSSDYVMTRYLSTADPTVTDPTRRSGVASFAFNTRLFIESERQMGNQGTTTMIHPMFDDTFFADGLSNTILVGGHYAVGCDGTTFSWFWSSPARTTITGTGIKLTGRRASFADIPDIGPELTQTPTVTFQVRPALIDCDPRVPQTGHASGLLVGMADGSVRLLAPNISPGTFWGAVSPAGGEVLGPDW